MKAVHKYGYERFHWEGLKLFHEKDYMGELIPHDVYENHWHLKFMWREEKIPEFFNMFNAKDNFKRIALFRLNYDMWETVVCEPVGAFK